MKISMFNEQKGEITSYIVCLSSVSDQEITEIRQFCGLLPEDELIMIVSPKVNSKIDLVYISFNDIKYRNWFLLRFNN